MEIAKIQINSAYAKAIRRIESIPANLIGGYIVLEYADNLWDDLSKTVVFRNTMGACKDIVSNSTIIKVPHEVLEQVGGELEVGFYGVSADDTIAIPTFCTKLGTVRKSADPCGDESTDPSLPVYAQLLMRIEGLEKNGVGKTGPQGIQGEAGPAGYTPIRGTDYYTEADKQEMVSLVLAAMPVWEGGSY